MKIENRTELKEYRIECQKKQSADCRVLVCGGTGCLASGSGKIYEKLKELTKDEPRMEVLKLQTKYPQGGERQLIYAVTGRAINSKMLPADAGCVVDNVDTVIAVYEAVILGKPVMDRIVTVTGQGIKNPQNFDVLSGTDMAELIEAAGGLTDNVSKAISGGPMTLMYHVLRQVPHVSVWRRMMWQMPNRLHALTAADV